MKALKTKVILSAFVLLFALVATIGSTYAWFTVSNTVVVSALNIEVTTQESLLIRVYDGETELGTDVSNYTFDGHAGSADDFVNTISTSLITASSEYTDFGTYLLQPVTALSPTTTGETDYDVYDLDNISTIDISNTANRNLTAALKNTTGATGGYIELKFWLMVQSGSNITVELSAFSATGSTVSQALYLGTQADAADRVYAIDPDFGFEFLSTDSGYSATTSLNTVEAASITTLLGLDFVAGADDTVVTLSADIPELVTVLLWIEGWDAEATNSLMGLSTDVSFSFAIFS